MEQLPQDVQVSAHPTYYDRHETFVLQLLAETTGLSISELRQEVGLPPVA